MRADRKQDRDRTLGAFDDCLASMRRENLGRGFQENLAFSMRSKLSILC